MDSVLVCIDCTVFIKNGELSECLSHQQELAIIAGSKELDSTYKFGSVDLDEFNEFSLAQCQCCKTKLAGSRYKYVHCGLK